MADNFLEKQYENWKNGRAPIRRNSPSLDSLVKRLSEHGPADTSYMVKQAQLDAIVRTASALDGALEFSTDENSASITVRSADRISLGEALLAIRLKAAELKLQSCTTAVSDTSVTIGISRAL